MGEIIKLAPKLAAKDTPMVDPGIVEGLEAFLERAKKGEIIAIGVVMINGDYEPMTGWCNNAGCVHELISGLSVLMRDLQDSMATVPHPMFPKDSAS
jgi:hypothetical protein